MRAPTLRFVGRRRGDRFVEVGAGTGRLPILRAARALRTTELEPASRLAAELRREAAELDEGEISVVDEPFETLTSTASNFDPSTLLDALPTPREVPAPNTHSERTVGMPSLLRVFERSTTGDVIHVAWPATLGLSDAEVEQQTVPLGEVLDHLADIDELAIGDVEPITHRFPVTNVLRGDIVADRLGCDGLLGQAPDSYEGWFAGPSIIGLEV